MDDKELRVVKKHTQGLPERLYQLVLDQLEEALKNRPFWLKVIHFIKGNSAWIEETVLDIVERVKSRFGDEADGEE